AACRSHRVIAVGVDAGGSHTVAVAMRDGELLRSATGPAANLVIAGIDRAASAIGDAIAAATELQRPDAVVVGVAGAGTESVKSELLAVLTARFPQTRIEVTDDAHIALRAAVPAGDAIALIAGTGSIAYAEIGANAFRAGGFGYLVGDEGSGFMIGAAAVRLALKAAEGRAPSDALTQAVLARIGASHPRDAVALLYAADTPVANVASFAAVVLESAAAGERSAVKIVQTAALDLFDLVRSICRIASVGSGKETPLALCGGLLSENSMLTYLLETRVSNELPNLAIVKNSAAPHFGALAQARALAGDA
ncbi:MAG TPA: BadF/BadG/BcrA/BcrD ATPase family protein, partial [Candidatus Baltobacteraceae bacterium]|nr:BadF/BadG/BcrA/BcrD ATPase family protein [Candidatus Baltobacteraceae bacterium]